MKRKERTLDAKAAGAFLRGWARRFLPGWKITIRTAPKLESEEGEESIYAMTHSFHLDREVLFTIYVPIKIDPKDSAQGLPRARVSWELISFHEIAHAIVSLPLQAMRTDTYRIKKHLPPALAEDFLARMEDYEEGIVNCLAVSLALAVEDELD